jgi:hypothetical protein
MSPPPGCTRFATAAHPPVVSNLADEEAMMTTTYEFLSPEWLDAVRQLKTHHIGEAVDQEGFLVNGVITDVPFGQPVREMHSSHGPVIGWQPGLDPTANVTIRVRYPIARSLVTDDAPNTLELALHAGEIEVDGEFDAFRDWWRSRVGDTDIAALEAEIRGITA